jgi:hypothetical protein
MHPFHVVHRHCLALTLFAGLPSLAAADPGQVGLGISPSGPYSVGQVLTVTMRLNFYTDTNEIDGFRLALAYPSPFLSYVPNSADFGDEAGPNQQWLLKPNQETDDFVLSGSVDGATAGSVRVWLRDGSHLTPERGTRAVGGFLIGFRLRIDQAGVGLIRGLSFDGGGGPEVFYNTAGAPAGVPSFEATFISAQDLRPRMSVTRSGSQCVISWPVPSQPYVLQRSTNLNFPIGWLDAPDPVLETNGNHYVVVPRQGAQQYFRLRQL